MPSENAGETPHIPDTDLSAIPEAGWLGRVLDRLSGVFAMFILASAGILIFEVFMRYVFNAPTTWGHETVVFMTACAFIYGGLFVAARDKHIRVVLIYDYVSPRVRRIMNVVISILCLISAIFFTWATWVATERAIFTPAGEFRFETSGSAFNAPYPGILRLFLFVVMLLMAIQFLILAFNYARRRG